MKNLSLYRLQPLSQSLHSQSRDVIRDVVIYSEDDLI